MTAATVGKKCSALCAAVHNRRYRIDLDALDVENLRDLQRLLRDIDHEKRAAVNCARIMPWTR